MFSTFFQTELLCSDSGPITLFSVCLALGSGICVKLHELVSQDEKDLKTHHELITQRAPDFWEIKYKKLRRFNRRLSNGVMLLTLLLSMLIFMRIVLKPNWKLLAGHYCFFERIHLIGLFDFVLLSSILVCLFVFLIQYRIREERKNEIEIYISNFQENA